MPSKQEVPLVRIIGFTLVKFYFTEMSYLHSVVCLSKMIVIFSKTAPSLNTMIKIANFLEMSIDYILYKSEDNHFKKYKLNQTNFYNNLKRNMQLLNISQSQLCKDLNISRTNFSRWNNGTSPSITKLITLTNYLNCTINDLLDFE